MSHVHVKINFSFGIDSWNRCLGVHKRLQIPRIDSKEPIQLAYVAGEGIFKLLWRPELVFVVVLRGEKSIPGID
jgi:hypothetical protein